MSRQSLSRANQTFFGRAVLGNYQTGKPGGEVNLPYRYRPSGNRAITFTAGLAAGALSGTLSANWNGNTGIYLITFSDGETAQAILTNGQTTCVFLPGSFPQTGGSYGTFGGLVGAVTSAATVANTAPVLGVANAIFTTAAIALNTPTAPTGALASAGVATLDVPRNVVAAWTGTAVMTVTGTDFWGYAQTEASASGTSMTGKKAFATITSISVSANVTGATVGTGAVLGLPFLAISGDLISTFYNDVPDTGTFVAGDPTAVATSTTGDVRGTYTASAALNGAKFLAITYKPKDPSTQVGLFGVTPA